MSPSDTRISFAPDVVFQKIDGEALVLKLQGELVFSLNETGARIAELIAGGHTTEDIVERLGREYDLEPAHAQSAVETLIRSLESRGLVIVGERV